MTDPQMEDILKQALIRAPELVVFTVLVVWLSKGFLGALKDAREAAIKSLEQQANQHANVVKDQRESASLERLEFVRRMTEQHKDHMDARAESREALDRFANALDRLGDKVSEKIATAVANLHDKS